MEEGWYEEEEDEEVVVKSENVASSRSRSHPTEKGTRRTSLEVVSGCPDAPK